MPFTVTETVTALAVQLRTASRRLHDSLRVAMARIAIGLQSYIMTQKLEGQVLHHRSGKLVRSIQQHLEENGNTISAVVQAGTLAPYAVVHEWGGTFLIPAHLSHSAQGREYWVREHTATYPERSFMRSSLREYRDPALREIRAAIQEAVA